MNVFKLKPGNGDWIPLSSPAVFHATTSKKYPWFQERGGNVRHYATCPECDNPIQVINLDVDSKVDGAGRSLPLYAKHVAFDVPELAVYDEDAYNECGLANPRSFNGTERRPANSRFADEILQLLVREPDALHIIAERFLDAHIPDELFAAMLMQFKNQQGHLYRAVTTSNLPYAVLYMSGSQDLFTCRPKSGTSPVAQALSKSTSFELRNSRIVRRTGAKGSLRFFVTDHKQAKSPEDNDESMKLIIEEHIGEEKKPLYGARHELKDIPYFRNLVGKRERFREMAKEVFGDR
ncbi:hypothetical protein HI806_01920 [Ralstonia solanacearum]|nr:hypothetical protein HI806_01920 [Ralstonia solanacearum]QKL75333.1 hypothetical protein HI805_01920 [Ralstonia solanacearum]QKL80534.1 hypothetical protein HI804_01925 [Ralstonia solanacearum]QKL85747.1 hypothetical protein HI803_01925 [Ralstonia solanacearum]QKM01112.1 hypothetical protein HI800_01925 [Ralstonia solanacearum]